MSIESSDADRSWEFFEAVRAHMARHGHPATPRVYEVWYAYASRQDAELVERLDHAIALPHAVPLALIEALHEEFFARERQTEVVRQTGEKLSNELTRILQMLANAGRDTSSFADALEKIAARLPADGELRKIVDTIVLATRHMEAKTRRLESELERCSVEIRALRQGLEASKREAMTDPLTGLYNRRAFEERLRLAAAHSMETDTEMALLLSDIDSFKQLNDSWGHQVGDAVIQLVASCLKEGLPPGATAARYGGDEFAAVLPGLSVTEAEALADKTRELVGKKRLRDASSGKSIGHLSVSIGVAGYVLAERLDELVRRADQALYGAKGNGRNQVKAERVPGNK
ncbi:GGDEF domain-containing protein [Aliidongia dinghuensis]|uniref:diguanylate cyclase n=1 Tax=Aliidongia dinghuensis TaxID=1867774 RepID=A0A8J2YW21_9PROT|nr:GGDEF domain-containing protein [Aliidongia dinghuensis]GGF23155.1 GGDEF domain-containing protein [Aliidongia dinghuensis]